VVVDRCRVSSDVRQYICLNVEAVRIYKVVCDEKGENSSKTNARRMQLEPGGRFCGSANVDEGFGACQSWDTLVSTCFA
jgi:hypothetical protein